MKPLLRTVVAICLLLGIHAHPENIEEVKELPPGKEPVVEAEESQPQARVERCSACSSTINLAKSPKEIVAALQSLPAGEVHTQQSFEGCSSSKGCAGIKLQDGKVTQKFGNLNAFGGNDAFKAASAFGSNVLGGKNTNEPFWWMGANSPFKNVNSESFQSKSSSYSSSGSSSGFAAQDLSKNAFLNPNVLNGQASFESSSYQKEFNVANNPFLNGNINRGQGNQAAQGFASNQNSNAFSSAFGSSQSSYSGGSTSSEKFAGVGYTGSSPAPFATATGSGSNVNLIQTAQKEFDFGQSQQTIGDDIFAGSTPAQGLGVQGDLQQTCAGQGNACVLKATCVGGAVNAANVPLASIQKQYCNTRTETCCRLVPSSVGQSNLGLGFDAESQGSGLISNTATYDAQNSFSQNGFGVQSGSSSYDANQSTFGSTIGSNVPAVTAVPAGSTGSFGASGSSSGSYGSTLRPVTGQSSFGTDSFSSQSENTNIYRPGSGSSLKPGIPYLPPVDNTNSGSNVVSSTAFPSTLVTSPRPFTTPRPVSSPRPFNTPLPVTTPRPLPSSRPTYLPPVSSTSAPGYLPPVGEQTINRETFVPSPNYNEGGIILDESRFPSTTRQPTVPILNEIPAGCAAALKCTPIEFCTADGIISNTTVVLTRDQNAYRVPLTDCRDLETGRIGKCCRDPFYTDPWPTNQLGQWVPGVFGGNDGKYVPDSRVSSSTSQQVTGTPFITGSTILNNFRTPKPTLPTFTGQGQIGIREQTGGIGQVQGTGQRNKFGFVSQGITQVETGMGQYTENGIGQKVVQGGGVGIKQGVGLAISQGVGTAVENEVSASTRRIYLQRYDGAGQCGIKHPQRPYGNHDDLEVDFAEIPWQAMVLLQTNRSLLCGGVISRPDVVITSAACVDGLEAKNVLVKGGEWKLGIDEEPLPFQIVQVKTIVFHPGYKPGSLKDDVAILHLAENLRFANNIQPICMPDSKDSINAFYSGAGQCIVTGWGKIVLQAHLEGSIMHSVNMSLVEPTECESRLQQDYPHLLDNYDQESCACGQPSNSVDNVCKVDIGSALACTTGDGYFVLQGIYSWDSGCQIGNQLAAFYKFDIEWYEWAIGVSESVRYEVYGRGTKVTTTKYTSGTKGIFGQGQYTKFGVGQIGKGEAVNTGKITTGQFGGGQLFGQGALATANFSQFGGAGSLDKFTKLGQGSLNLGADIKGPISNTFSATYTEKKFFQTEPKYITYTTKPEIVTYTTKPEIVTFTTKPEYVTFTTKPEYVTYTTKPEIFTYTTKPKIITYTTKPKIITYTTKPKIVTYTTKPQFITYETSGSGTNPQYVAPGVTFNPSFQELVAQHKHSEQCKCLENGKK